MVRFTEILLLVLREDAPSAASSEYIESLQRSILPKPKQQSTTEQRNSSSSGNSTTDTLDMVEDFPMVKTVQNLFQIESSVHRQKIRDLLPVCTEAVRYHLVVLIIANPVLLELPFGFKTMH